MLYQMVGRRRLQDRFSDAGGCARQLALGRTLLPEHDRKADNPILPYAELAVVEIILTSTGVLRCRVMGDGLTQHAQHRLQRFLPVDPYPCRCPDHYHYRHQNPHYRQPRRCRRRLRSCCRPLTG